MATAFIAWGLSKSAEYQRQADNHAAEYAAYTYDKIRKSCPSPIVGDQYKCLAEARHEQRNYERDEQDLVAQRQSALWAYIMGAAAVIGMGLSVIGVFLVWSTFQETKRTADEAQRNVEAFIDAEKARLSVVEDRGMIRNGADQYVLYLRIRNYGRSPCLIKKIEYAGLQNQSWHNDFRDVKSTSRDLHVHVIPDAKSHIEVGKIFAPVGSEYVTVAVTYETQFNRNCVAHFLWKLSGPESGAGIKLKKRSPQNWPEHT